MKKNGRRKSHRLLLPITFMVGPTAGWLFAFLVLPLIYAVAMSFAKSGIYGGIVWEFSVANYADMCNPIYFRVAVKSLKLAFDTSLWCLIISYPFAYILSKISNKWKGLCMLLIMLPFWINGLIRLNGWANVLRDTGLINTALLKLGIIHKPIEMMFTNGAILFGMVYTFFPFMVLPILTSISKIDKNLIEAAQDLGATRIKTFIRVIFPLTVPGVFAGVIQVFIPSLGAFYISDIMGGGNTTLIGNLIKNQFLSARNWPLGAAFSVAMILFTLIVMRLYSKVGNLEDMA
jgi:spermidine/putrescine transport system permease protein